MNKVYSDLNLEQQAREDADRQLTIEYLASPEYQGILDAKEGEEPNPEFILNREYWISYCKALHDKYCNKFETYPKQTFVTPEMEELMF